LIAFETGLGKENFRKMIETNDFEFVAEVCENSAGLHRTTANTYGIMPSRSPLDIHINGTFLLPFMTAMAEKFSLLTK